MDTLLNEEEQLLKGNVREFLETECPTSLVREMEEDELGYPPALWAQAAELGWLGLALPEEYGGDGGPLTHLGLVLEEAGRAAAPLPLHSTMVPALAIAESGSDALRSELLPRVARGDAILTWAVIEADAQSKPDSIGTTATANGDGFHISGTKFFVDNFNVAEKCLVACRTSPASSQNEGISLFLVDTNSAGISQTPLPNMASDKQSQVTFDNVAVPADRLVGTVDEGWSIVEPMEERATALLCAQMVGATRKAVDMAVDYSKDRVAFGRPIGAFQSIQHICADIVTWVDGADLLTYEALWRLSEGLPATTHVSSAKAFCNERCLMCLHQANQIHAGIAQIKEFDLNLWYRRASAWSMRLGTTFDHQRKVADAILD